MGWLNRRSPKNLAAEIAENQDTLSAIREGLSNPEAHQEKHARKRAMMEREAKRIESEIEDLREQLVSTPLTYYRDCAFCIGNCKGH
jgi:septal ring factor EnvC (AmiA/AmiB activator)